MAYFFAEKLIGLKMDRKIDDDEDDDVVYQYSTFHSNDTTPRDEYLNNIIEENKEENIKKRKYNNFIQNKPDDFPLIRNNNESDHTFTRPYLSMTRKNYSEQRQFNKFMDWRGKHKSHSITEVPFQYLSQFQLKGLHALMLIINYQIIDFLERNNLESLTRIKIDDFMNDFQMLYVLKLQNLEQEMHLDFNNNNINEQNLKDMSINKWFLHRSVLSNAFNNVIIRNEEGDESNSTVIEKNLNKLLNSMVDLQFAKMQGQSNLVKNKICYICKKEPEYKEDLEKEVYIRPVGIEEVFVILPCKHAYHLNCLLNNAAIFNECLIPFCGQKLFDS